MNGFNWQIEHQCPQCGAPVGLDETDRIFACAFCRTRLYISTADHLRYYIPPQDKAAEDILYIPYWRVRGLAYTFEPLTMTDRYVDTNISAMGMPGLPSSLGLRPQAMKLKFVTPDSQGVFLKPLKAIHDVMPETNAAAIGTHHVLFIGEAISLIYTPVTIKNSMLYDAVLQRPVAPWHSENLSEFPVEEMCLATKFVSTLCPSCGWDLKGEKDTLVLTCANCNTAWSCEDGAFKQIPFAVMNGTASPLIYLPFWRIKPKLQGIKATSCADFIRLANLPKVATPLLEEKPLYFWSPAFKLHPALFLRWSRQMTIFQPEDHLGDEFPSGAIYPVNLSLAEAVESILATLGNTATDKRMFYQNLPYIRGSLDEYLLVYHPFAIDQREFRHEKMGLVIDKNALHFGTTM
ncbi:MAG: hypothetical protein PHN75_10155 [Syntrophales bacterium]|nr:hypothetical protein [Syntrophales bacterium]